MFSVTSATRVLVATTPVDLRGSFNRLYSLVVEQLKGDPLSGHLFVFAALAGNTVSMPMSLFYVTTGLLQIVREPRVAVSCINICHGSFAAGLCVGTQCKRKICAGTLPCGAEFSAPRALTTHFPPCGSFFALCICAVSARRHWRWPYPPQPISAAKDRLRFSTTDSGASCFPPSTASPAKADATMP